MTLRNPSQILQTQRAVLAVNVVNLEHAEAFISASEKTGLGLVMQISENAVKYHGHLAPIGKAMLELATNSTTPIAVHLDHATERELVTEAIELGFNSVMFDGSKLDTDENIKQTVEVVVEAKAKNVWVEAEIGEIGGKDGVHAPGVKTSVEDAVYFFEACGVDGLAVAVGSSHAMSEKTATLDIQRITEIAKEVDAPLVLHGSSGVSKEQLIEAIDAGIRKINLSTELNKAFTESIRETLNSDQGLVDPRKYFTPARDSVRSLVTSYLAITA